MPEACRSGIAPSSGTRAMSQMSIVRRVPRRRAIAPPQKPSSAIGRISAISTQVIRCGDPVVRRTNHGSASQVICVPSGRDHLGAEQRGEAAVAQEGQLPLRRRS